LGNGLGILKVFPDYYIRLSKKEKVAEAYFQKHINRVRVSSF
jgi:hypothetical protein